MSAAEPVRQSTPTAECHCHMAAPGLANSDIGRLHPNAGWRPAVGYPFFGVLQDSGRFRTTAMASPSSGKTQAV